jgi:glycosyltransferase involved in cell wall biosynthesis
MRVLWLSPCCVDISEARTATGGWLDTLARALIADGSTTLTVLHPIVGSCVTSARAGPMTILGVPRKALATPLETVLRIPGLGRTREFLLQSREVDLGSEIVDSLPSFDAIHIHGSEGPWLSIANRLRGAKALSIQGILSDYSRGFWSGVGYADRARCPKLALRALEMRKRAERERRYLPQFSTFLCRTEYSAAFVRSTVRSSLILNDGRILRAPFYSDVQWRPRTAPGHFATAITTVSEQPYKGVHHVMHAMLAPQLRHVQLKVLGVRTTSEYGQFLRRLARRLRMEDRLQLAGPVNALGIRQELLSADIYVHGATQENSPNAVAEAMALGLPCVGFQGGGTGEYLVHGQGGLVVTNMDITGLSDAMYAVLADRALALRLGTHARAIALERHCPSRVLSATRSAYEQIASARMDC